MTEPNKNEDNLASDFYETGITDAIYENPLQDISKLETDDMESYTKGYEEAMVENSNRWIIEGDE